MLIFFFTFQGLRQEGDPKDPVEPPLDLNGSSFKEVEVEQLEDRIDRRDSGDDDPSMHYDDPPLDVGAFVSFDQFFFLLTNFFLLLSGSSSRGRSC